MRCTNPAEGEAAVAAFLGTAHPGRLSGLSDFYSKPVLYGVFVWARRVLNSRKRRFPARAASPVAEGFEALSLHEVTMASLVPPHSPHAAFVQPPCSLIKMNRLLQAGRGGGGAAALAWARNLAGLQHVLRPLGRCAPPRQGEKGTTLAQKLSQRQPFIVLAVYP